MSLCAPLEPDGVRSPALPHGMLMGVCRQLAVMVAMESVIIVASITSCSQVTSPAAENRGRRQRQPIRKSLPDSSRVCWHRVGMLPWTREGLALYRPDGQHSRSAASQFGSLLADGHPIQLVAYWQSKAVTQKKCTLGLERRTWGCLHLYVKSDGPPRGAIAPME